MESRLWASPLNFWSRMRRRRPRFFGLITRLLPGTGFAFKGVDIVCLIALWSLIDCGTTDDRIAEALGRIKTIREPGRRTLGDGSADANGRVSCFGRES